MIHRSKAGTALLAALLLAAAAPTASLAAEPTGPAVVDATPLDTNLLRNGGFGVVNSNEPIPGWTVVGDVHVEKFGDRAWPYPAYGKKYNGGSRYLACGKRSGLVRQTVDFHGWSDRSFPLQAKLQTDFGGTIGHSIRVSLRVTGTDPEKYAEKYKTLEITNHYKVDVASLRLPYGAEHIEATVELIRKDGASSCKMVADSVKLLVFRP